MITQKKHKITQSTQIATNYFKIQFQAPEIAQACQPGQFINIKVTDTLTPLLRKPFSIYEKTEDIITIIVKAIGKGTQILSQKKPGEELDIIGPLGFPHQPIKREKTALIAGGIGLAALGLIAQQLKNSFDLFNGIRTKSELFDLPKWQKISNNMFISSDDGSYSEKGFITDLFQKHRSNYEQIYCCGPKIMMKKIYDICPKTIKTFFVLEEYMACGLGLCMGCVTKTTKGYKCICKQGPVFEGKDLIW